MATKKTKVRPRPRPRAALFSNLTLLVPTPGICMFCGCTEHDACVDGCSWINDERDWCSACADSLVAVLAGWLLGRAGTVRG